MLEALKFAYGDIANLGVSSSNVSHLIRADRGKQIKSEISDTKVNDSLGYYLGESNLLDLNVGGEQYVSVIGSDGYIVSIVM